jgi:hypothetical protein
MKKFMVKHCRDIISILLIIIVSSAIRFINLDKIPINITGDEANHLLDVYRIILGKESNPYGFLGDGTEASLTFYWSVLWVLLLGLENGIWAIRIATSILSIISLIFFYLLLKNKTSVFISLIFTMLLSGNYVFLNFSRTAWLNMWVICMGLLFLYFIEKAVNKKSILLYGLSGLTAGMAFLGYHYGKIFTIFTAAYLPVYLYSKNFWRIFAWGKLLVFYKTLMLVVLPFIILSVYDNGKSVLLRPKSVAVFNSDTFSSGEKFWKMVGSQFSNTFKGMVLLDPKVMSRGFEQPRYVPWYTAPVDPVIRLLFINGIIAQFLFFRFTRFRQLAFWWIVGLSSILTNFLTVTPPNFARGLFYIVFIYFISGVFVYFVFSNISVLPIGKRVYRYIKICFLLITFFLFYYNTKLYFDWMRAENTGLVRKPALSYEEYPVWQKAQIERIKNSAPK